MGAKIIIITFWAKALKKQTVQSAPITLKEENHKAVC